ncbi:hypothetical protein [uncultured Selenomonas sp.]|uniref:hypothetical protein n=1 Tax=uncultured Selenomonas sp. TaxID=159275 RepID=UPI0028D850FE|nr:hypothetical protein [uncultured Selenomonas sp.]
MEYTTLANDLKMPLLGIGTFMISPADAEVSVYKALKNGYRLIDTANAQRGDGRKVRLDAARV